MWKLILSAILCLNFCSVATAREKGDTEQNMMLGIGCGKSDDIFRADNWTAYLVQLDAGWFLSDRLSTGIRMGGELIDANHSEDELAIYSGLYMKYHFKTESDFMPYIGGQVAYWWHETQYYNTYKYYPPKHESTHEDQGFMYGPIVGIKYYINQGTFLSAEYQWRLFTHDVGDILDGESVGLVGIGFSF
ncbi:MAG: outer membrane beta-barrel protein [Sedimentisphaerales bacterium]|nr:outer membrane beta-barrel protein [Sedimentisphaerales bacterium]